MALDLLNVPYPELCTSTRPLPLSVEVISPPQNNAVLFSSAQDGFDLWLPAPAPLDLSVADTALSFQAATGVPSNVALSLGAGAYAGYHRGKLSLSFKFPAPAARGLRDTDALVLTLPVGYAST